MDGPRVEDPGGEVKKNYMTLAEAQMGWLQREIVEKTAISMFILEFLNMG